MVEWTDEAIHVAQKAYWRAIDEEEGPPMRAALDAAVKAQKEVKLEGYAYHAPSYMRGRAEALEKAAKICDGMDESEYPMEASDCAAAIRALKDKPANQTDGGE